MATKAFRGLVECPMHEGWIEFAFQPGDTISDLVTSIDAKWGAPTSHRFGRLGKGWLFFCAQKDGDYQAMCKDDPIPTAPPDACGRRFTDEHIDHELDAYNVFDVMFLDRDLVKHPRELHLLRGSVEFDRNFSLALPFKRTYDLPIGKEYDVHLVALLGIVGG